MPRTGGSTASSGRAIPPKMGRNPSTLPPLRPITLTSSGCPETTTASRRRFTTAASTEMGRTPALGDASMAERTSAGNALWDLVREEFDCDVNKVKSSDAREYDHIENKWSLQICLLLALTRAIGQADGHLLTDHEHPAEAIEGFVSDVAALWRKVLKKDDETLGLGLSDDDYDGSGANKTRESSREALCAMLQFYGSKIEEELASVDIEVRFDFMPRAGGAKRKAGDC